MSDGIFSSFGISAAGLRAQRARLDIAAENLANIETTRTASGEPYRPSKAVMESVQGQQTASVGAAPSFSDLLQTREGHRDGLIPAQGGVSPAGKQVRVSVQPVSDPFRSEFDPDHPDADADGMVLKPNVDPIQEMLTLIKATRAYEANATALDAAKDMMNRALEI